MRQAFPTWSARGVSVVMEKRKVFDRGAKFILAVWIAFVVAMSAGCAKKEGAGINYLGSFFSSDVMLFIAEDIPAEDHADMISACKEAMEEYDAAFSLARDDGELARFNAAASGERVKISALTENVLKKARSLFLSTGGAFDPTVYPLVDLWGFSHRFDALYEPAEIYDRVMGDDGSLPPPEKEYIDAFVRLADFGSGHRGRASLPYCPPRTGNFTKIQRIAGYYRHFGFGRIKRTGPANRAACPKSTALFVTTHVCGGKIHRRAGQICQNRRYN